jgi:hypothetical protein
VPNDARKGPKTLASVSRRCRRLRHLVVQRWRRRRKTPPGGSHSKVDRSCDLPDGSMADGASGRKRSLRSDGHHQAMRNFHLAMRSACALHHPQRAFAWSGCAARCHRYRIGHVAAAQILVAVDVKRFSRTGIGLLLLISRRRKPSEQRSAWFEPSLLKTSLRL